MIFPARLSKSGKLTVEGIRQMEYEKGVPRIFSEMKEAGLPEPKIIETAANVTIVLHNGKKVEESPRTTEKILEILKEHPYVTAGQIAEKLRITVDGVDYNIRKLKNQGRIVRIGGDKGGRWEIVEK